MMRRVHRINSFLVVFLVFLVMFGLQCVGGTLAHGDVDRAGDGPRQSAPKRQRLDSLKKNGVGANNIMVFGIYSDPELDFYQPCNGGDNLIDFNIDVSGVNLKNVKSATLTLAVWDIDYNCDISVCERDIVSINGQTLTNPQSFLTGADEQWSTVSFEVDPAFIVNGANYIQIMVDTLSGGWCASCDWAELTINLSEGLEINDLLITPADPTTGNTVTFEAQVTKGSDIEIVNVNYGVWDRVTGTLDTAIASENLKQDYKPPLGRHGQKKLICGISYKNTSTGESDVAVASKEFKLFFEKDARSSFWNIFSPPNWFVFWNRDGAVSMPGAKYDWNCSAYGYQSGMDIFLCSAAGGTHYNRPIVVNTFFGKESFGGPTVRGIDCASEVYAHEAYHRWVRTQWATGGGFVGKPDSDAGSCSSCNDAIPDFYETATSHTSNSDTDTYDLEHLKDSQYRTYGDQEYMAMRTGNGARGTPQKDWANPGRQTSQSTGASALSSSTLVALREAQGALVTSIAGNFSDEGIDTNGNGLYDHLAINADFEVAAADSYGIGATLRDANGRVVDTLRFSQALAEGVSTVQLKFDGRLLNRNGVDGTYDLSVELLNAFGDRIAIKRHVYTTEAYEHTKFEGQQVRFSGVFSDQGLDVNADGIFEFISVSVGLRVNVAGSYSVDAYLNDAQGNPVAYAMTSGEFPAGDQTVELRFDRGPVVEKRVNGRLILTQLRAWGQDVTTLDAADNTYRTSHYKYTEFQSGTAHFNDILSDSGADTDSDGYFNILNVKVGVVVSKAGDYRLLGSLYDSNNNEIASSTVYAQLATGTKRMTLRFEGASIYKNMVDGPYILKNLMLYDAASGQVLDMKSVAGDTSAYKYEQFQKSPVAFTGEFSDYLADLDNDGYMDTLVIEVGVMVDADGNYALNGRLMDGAGVEIEWGALESWLAAGSVTKLALCFSGAGITSHGVDGPYLLRDPHFYNTADTSQSATLKNAWTTSAYRALDFGNHYPVANAGGPYEGRTGVELELDASASTDPDGRIVSWEWDWNGDGVYEEETPSPMAKHTWSKVGNYAVNLRVTDNDGLSAVGETVVAITPGTRKTTLCADLGAGGPTGDADRFTLTGEENEIVKLNLQAEDAEGSQGKRATVIVSNAESTLGVYYITIPWNKRIVLPVAGIYRILLQGNPLLPEELRFEGAYCLSVSSSGNAWRTLEPNADVE